MNTDSIQTLTQTYECSQPLNIGDYVYKVDKIGEKIFRAKCPICDGKEYVTLKNRVFKCPNCSKNQTANDCLQLVTSGYVVHKYKIYDIAIRIQDRTYTSTRRDMPKIKFKAFHKSGSAHVDKNIYIIFTPNEIENNLRLENSNRNENDVVFFASDYSKAVELAETLNNEQKRALESFNESNETHHTYPDFDAKNDLPVRPAGTTKKTAKDANKKEYYYENGH